MTNGSYLEFPAGPDTIGQIIYKVTGGPAHIAICVSELISDDTVWDQKGRIIPISGVRETRKNNQASLGNFIAHDPIKPWTVLETELALQAVLDEVNARRPYNVAELLLDAVVYPTRKFWIKIGIIPFGHSRDFVCSSYGAYVVRATGRDPWPGVATPMIAPVDFVNVTGPGKEWT